MRISVGHKKTVRKIDIFGNYLRNLVMVEFYYLNNYLLINIDEFNKKHERYNIALCPYVS